MSHRPGTAAASFPRVALYFENSLLPPDLALLPSAAATVSRIEKLGPKTVIDSASGVGLPWHGPAVVDGQPWPAADAEITIVAGNAVEPAVPEAFTGLNRIPILMLGPLLHRHEHVGQAQHHLGELMRDLVVDGMEAGRVRADVPPDELVGICFIGRCCPRDCVGHCKFAGDESSFCKSGQQLEIGIGGKYESVEVQFYR